MTLSRKRSIFFYLITFLLIVTVVLAPYLIFLLKRSVYLYGFVKTNEYGFVGNTHGSDPTLGYRPMPDTNGYGLLEGGGRFAISIDEHGFRVPSSSGNVDAIHEENGPNGIMAIGDSFTFGLGVEGDETFTHILGEMLEMRTMNAGVSGYGIAQMVLRSRELIPKFRPDYVIVQYSPWLIERSTQRYAPVRETTAPSPYYTGHGNLSIAGPVYEAIADELPIDLYRDTPIDTDDFLSFFLRVAVPLYLYEDVQSAFLAVRDLLGSAAEPAEDFSGIVGAAYKEIEELCDKHGAQMLIVVLGRDHSVTVPYDLLPSEVPVVDVQSELIRRLPDPSPESYSRNYFIWKGLPPRLATLHPNRAVHGVIAEMTGKAIREMPTADAAPNQVQVGPAAGFRAPAPVANLEDPAGHSGHVPKSLSPSEELTPK